MINKSCLPLVNFENDFAMDSSGFRTTQSFQWLETKHKKIKRQTKAWHDWYKLHINCGINTNIITSLKITERYSNDSPHFKELFETTLENGFVIKEQSADKGYISKKNLKIANKYGVEAYIPFKSNAKFDEKNELWNKLLYFFLTNKTEFKKKYHKRSNSETVFFYNQTEIGRENKKSA
jgi:transposase